MSITPVAPRAPLAPAATQARAQAAPTGGAYSPYAYDAYAGQQTGPGIGKIASWVGGGYSAIKWVLPMFSRGRPGGIPLIVAGLGGAWAGGKIYDAVTTGRGFNTGEVGRYASWIGGAALVSRYLLAGAQGPMKLLGMAAGAFGGNWLYDKFVSGR